MKKKKKRIGGQDYELFVDTKKGRVQVPQWVHVRQDMWQEIIDVLECVKNECADGDIGWLGDEAKRLLKEFNI